MQSDKAITIPVRQSNNGATSKGLGKGLSIVNSTCVSSLQQVYINKQWFKNVNMVMKLPITSIYQ
jgi:hypothetical protein